MKSDIGFVECICGLEEIETTNGGLFSNVYRN